MEFPLRQWDRSAADQAAGAGGSLFERLLVARGIAPEEQEAFCSPSLKHGVQHPSAMHGMLDAAAVICEALQGKRSIAIYGDYDVDGVMSTAIIYHMLRAIDPAARVRTYIPHRIEEGYGLNADAIRRLHAEGVECIITVDCGLAAPDEVALARSLGMRIVVTDHHEPREDGLIPQADAVVHPRLAPSQQRFGELCGAGVAWKLAWMCAEHWSTSTQTARDPQAGPPSLPKVLRDRLLTLLALAAVGTVADVVPLRGENRIIVSRGLLHIHDTGIAGMDALLSAARLGDTVSSTDVAFRFAPLINACGRLGHAEDAAEAFTTADARRAGELAALFSDLNTRRRKQDQEIFNEAISMVGAVTPNGIVLADRREQDGWNLGVVGIVCSKLVERYGCPAILLTRNQGRFKGSGRSVDGVDLHGVLASCSGHLMSFGGHAMAAGVMVEEHAIDAFAEAFDRACRELLPPPEARRPRLPIDATCTLAELDFESVRRLGTLAPFGRDNPSPAVLIESVEVTRVDPLGQGGEHVAVTVRQGRGSAAKFLRCMWWRAGARAAAIAAGMRLDIVVQPQLNAFRGQVSVEAELTDIRIADAVPAGGSR
ncbi:MAG: single-stranded-DNA-specific exonuclease RecJ [Planctomycetaceae bacterium]|nr:single-stranded-DNA-specific exonuclease RecJ [Planctomycetaceae bacterium]